MIYISLTTVPLRLIHWVSIKENLDSLLNQKTDKEYFIIFNIPYLYRMNDNEEYVIPNELIEYSNTHPKLIINRDVLDYGPIIKIYGAFKFATDPNDIIIALDDDNLYHEDMIERHLEKLNEYPDSVICFAGDLGGKITNVMNVDGERSFNVESIALPFPLINDEYMISPGHNGSVSYRRHFLEDDFNEDLFKLGDGDDPLVGYYLKMKNITIICSKHNYPNISFPIIRGIGFPHWSGGWLIREKSKESAHGRLDPRVSELLSNNYYIYKQKIK